jgi:hypothetical protein
MVWPNKSEQSHFQEERSELKAIYRRPWAKGIPGYKVGKTWRIAKKDIKWLRR